MIRLIRVELTRLLCRRAVLVLLMLAVAIPAVIGVATAWNTRPASAEDLGRAQAEVERMAEEGWTQREVRRCLESPRRYGGEGEVTKEWCERQVLPSPEDYLYRPQLDLAQEREEGSGLAVALLVGLFMFLAGTTYAGHDWNSGSVSNQLLFEPRRIRVWGAKAVAVAGVAAVAAGLVITSYWLALGTLARSRDLGPPEGVLLDCLQMGWRATAVAAAAAVGGYALTMLFRSTVAALGVLFVVALAGGIVIAVLGIDEQWNPATNLASVVLDGAPHWVDAPCPGGEGGCGVERTLPLWRGATYLGAFLAAAVAVSASSFWRRDVT